MDFTSISDVCSMSFEFGFVLI